MKDFQHLLEFFGSKTNFQEKGHVDAENAATLSSVKHLELPTKNIIYHQCIIYCDKRGLKEA